MICNQKTDTISWYVRIIWNPSFWARTWPPPVAFRSSVVAVTLPWPRAIVVTETVWSVKLQITHFPALYRKSLLLPGLSRQRRTRLNEWTSAFSPVSPLKEHRSILSASEGTVCLPGLSPVTVISCPGRDLLRCDIHRPKTPFLPTSLKLRHFWGTVLFPQGYRNCQKCQGGLLRIGGGNVTAPAPGHKATSPLSFPPAQVTPPSYTEFITSPSPYDTNV